MKGAYHCGVDCILFHLKCDLICIYRLLSFIISISNDFKTFFQMAILEFVRPFFCLGTLVSKFLPLEIDLPAYRFF